MDVEDTGASFLVDFWCFWGSSPANPNFELNSGTDLDFMLFEGQDAGLKTLALSPEAIIPKFKNG